MHWLHLGSLTLIGLTWAMAWRVGNRWTSACGVTERVSRWSLACAVPTAGLILSVHLLALVSLFVDDGLVAPEPVAIIFMLLTFTVHRLTRCLCPAPGASARAESLCPEPRASARADYLEATSKPLSTCLDQGAYAHSPVAGGMMGAPSPTPTSTAKRLWIPLAIVGLMYAVFLADAVTRFPTGYDALYYHLPVAVRWMQERSLDLVFGFNYLSNPDNGMIVPSLLASGKLERLISLVHFPKALLVGGVIFGLARAINVGRTGAWMSACVALSVPMVVFQSVSGYIDLYAAASWLSALLALTWAARANAPSQRRQLVFLAGLSAGVALGSKTTFLVLVPLLGLLAVGLERLRPVASRPTRRTLVHHAALFGAATLACSAFWFVRGTVQAGNPVYPLEITIGDRTILPGVSADDFFPKRTLATKVGRWWDYPWRETKHSGTGYPYSVNNALGAAYATFVPLGFLAAVAFLWRSRKNRVSDEVPASSDPESPRGLKPAARDNNTAEAARRWLAVYIAMSLTGVVLLLTVFQEMLRFVLPQVLLSVPVAALLVDRLATRRPRLLTSILCAALLCTATVAAYKPAHALAVRAKHGLWDRAAFYRVPGVIDELPPGARIVNLGDPTWNYPLLGRHLSNVVIDPGVWLESLCPEAMSEEALRENKIDYVFVQGSGLENALDALPLEIVFDDRAATLPTGVSPMTLYRVSPPQRVAGGTVAERQ